MHGVSRWSSAAAGTLAVLGLAGCAGETTGPRILSPASFVVGNGALSGPHWNLNIIGVPNPKNPDMSGAGGGAIFVALGSKLTTVTTKILLEQSASAGVFEVIDKNGTDGEATFSLPAPGSYTVWARALGKPGGQAKVTTCATDIADTPEVGDICSTLHEVFVRGTPKGGTKFRDVTLALTTISLDPVADAGAVAACGGTTVSLFDKCLEGYFWQYDNNGLKLLQIRFYPSPTL